MTAAREEELLSIYHELNESISAFSSAQIEGSATEEDSVSTPTGNGGRHSEGEFPHKATANRKAERSCRCTRRLAAAAGKKGIRASWVCRSHRATYRLADDALHGARERRRHAEAAVVQDVHCHLEAAAQLAQQTVGWDAHVVKVDLGRVGRLDSHLLLWRPAGWEHSGGAA